MNNLEQFSLIILLTQYVHSFEELSTGFHRKWYLMKVPFKLFLLFEILFNSFWGLVYFYKDFPNREYLLALFVALMFVNGIQHIVWAGVVKKYVPGLITGIVLVFILISFYFQVLF